MAPFKDPFSFLLPVAQGMFVCSVVFCVWTVTRPIPFLPAEVPPLVLSDGTAIPKIVPWEEYQQSFQGRNLFAPVEEAALPAAGEAQDLRVAGLLRARHTSIVLEGADGRTLFLSEGERHEQVLVKRIDDASVELEIEGRQLVLELGGRSL